MSLIGSIVRFFIERGASKATLPELAQQLEASAETISSRIRQAADTPKKRTVARHIIGIERWAQSRAQVLLGAPLKSDEYDDYRPDESLDMASLAQAFDETRQDSIRLAQELHTANIPVTKTVPHNDMGTLTVRGWIAYIDGHSQRESGQLK